MTEPAVQLLVALGLGLFVGLQRQHAGIRVAGLRTFGLVTLFGALTAQLGQAAGGTPWLVVAGVIALTALLVVSNMVSVEQMEIAHESGTGGEREFDGPGQTTEVAALVMYFVGAFVVLGDRSLAVAVGAAVAVLLHLKERLHDISERIDEADLRAIMQFAVLSLIVLPLLPDRTYGPYDVLNPRQIWWMVVLIVGIDLAGYAARRTMGERTGTALSGFLGGLISSTATTASYARRSASDAGAAAMAALVIVIASSVVFVRVLVEVGAVAPGFLPTAAPPVAILLGVFVVLALLQWRGGGGGDGELPARGNPSELKPALIFAALYAAVLLAVAAAQELLGDAGLYSVAVLSGLTDMDAITLSTANLVDQGRLAPDTGWRVIVLASLSNVIFKGGMVAVMGSRALLRRIAPAFGLVVVVGLLLIALWQ